MQNRYLNQLAKEYPSQEAVAEAIVKLTDRLLLDKIDFKRGTVAIDQEVYALRDNRFTTVNPQDPYTLTPSENRLSNDCNRHFYTMKQKKEREPLESRRQVDRH